MNHHVSNGESKVVDQTILSAREALQRRRRELQEQKSRLIDFREAEALSSKSIELSPTVLHCTLERGRALLAEANAHSEILRRYVSSGTIRMLRHEGGPDLSAMKDQMGTTNKISFSEEQWTDEYKHEFPGQGKRCNQYISNSIAPCDPTSNVCTTVSEIPVEFPDLDECVESGQLSTHLFGGDEEQEETLRGEEARARLELVVGMASQEDGRITPEKKISNFDPLAMNSAKRATVKKMKLEEAIATAEEQARLLTFFKALPLPGGVEVISNLFATTQSFQGKHIGLIRRDAKCNNSNITSSSITGALDMRDDISSVRSMTSRDNSFARSEFENDADRERARELLAEKKTKKRQLLNSINKIVSDDMQVVPKVDIESTDFGESCDFMVDPSKIRQDVARLEAKLKDKKTQRDATLNDIVDIDLNIIFGRLLPGETSDVAINIIDRMKERVFGHVNNDHCTSSVRKSAEKIQIIAPQRISVFQRQEEWSKRREQKLFNARIQLEADAMDGVTGKPEISRTTQSWKRAKESHDETLKITTEVEEKKHREKAEKEKVLNRIKAEEERKLQEQSKMPMSVKCEANKEDQMRRLEMLSRPRQTVEATFHVEPGTSVEQPPDHCPKSRNLGSVQPKKANKTNSNKVKKSSNMMDSNKNSTPTSGTKLDEFCGLSSFSDMSDKEFAKLIKRITKTSLAKVDESEEKKDYDCHITQGSACLIGN